jgi:hypothetical protein
MTAPLSDEQIAEIRKRADTTSPTLISHTGHVRQILTEDIPALLAELKRLKDERHRAALADAERIIDGYQKGRVKSTSLGYEMFGRVVWHLPAEVEAAFEHASKAYWVWQDSESPEGGRDVPDTDPLTHAHNCKVLLDEALAGLVAAVDAHTEARNTARRVA